MQSSKFRTITVMEATAVIVSSTIGVGVLALPRIAVHAADTGAPLVTLAGILFSFIGLSFVAALGKRFPEDSIAGYGEQILGTWMGRLGSVLLVLFFVVLLALTAREFGKVVVTAVLPHTPVPVTTVIMLLLAMIAARNNLSTFGYIHLFYLPFLLAPGFIIIILSLKNATWMNVEPFIGGSLYSFGDGILTVAALLQVGFVLSLVIPAMRHPEKAFRVTVFGVGVAGVLYLAIVTACLAVFGVEELKLLLWPTLDLAKTTTIPGEVMERLDALFLTVWVVAVFTTLYALYFFVVRMIKDLFHLEDHKFLTSFFFPMAFFLAMLPSDLFQLYKLVALLGKAGLLLTSGYPLLLWVVAVVRKKRGDSYVAPPPKSSRQ